MLEFYKKALLALLGLLLISALVAFWCLERAFLHLPLLPSASSAIAWSIDTETDDYQGGLSRVEVHDYRYSLDFELLISAVAEYPHAAVSLVFEDSEGEPILVDLSSYHSISFNVKCLPANVLGFTAYTFEEDITEPGDFLTYRSPNTYFSCDSQWSEVTLDLTRLETPQWWLSRFQLALSMKDYELNKVAKIMFSSSFQSPKETSLRIQINELRLHGRDWQYLYLLGVLLFILWAALGVWLFRQHTQALIGDLRNKIQKDRPLVAYQQLSMEPQHDRDKDAILRFLATEYANPDLNLDAMVSAIGVSRTKINDILKAELGFTFTGYLNKLRLTEAARLLAEKSEASIAEIAYSVGYKNVSYFNKLFKEEYGCTPKLFKNVYEESVSDSKD